MRTLFAVITSYDSSVCVCEIFSLKKNNKKFKTALMASFTLLLLITDTAWKVSKHGVFSCPYFPGFGPEKTPYLITFHAVWVIAISCTIFFEVKLVLIHFWLTRRKQNAELNKTESLFKALPPSTPRGSILRPVLLNFLSNQPSSET